MGIKRLIVNADDFGLSDGVNSGIERAHESGILTSASLMVRAPAAHAAATAAHRKLNLDLGIHLDLGEWQFNAGQWVALYERAPLDDPIQLENEVRAQLEMFESLIGSAPTHIDSHQHAHRNEPLKSIVSEYAGRLRVPLRHSTGGARYVGDFYGQDDRGKPYPERVSADFLIAMISNLDDGLTELCCHPAASVDFEGTYAAERLIETETLCDPRVKQELLRSEVVLTTFMEFTIP
ncbi:MAG TPA: ChbG/HpnK family deacetylase [Gemmatimonadaceae bacterium]|nr:ChbG/HpnK family deacetylase [Gemmatimonadaceae bacterium]